VRLQELTAELARAFRLPDTSGAAVVEVFRRSPAERAALQAGDVIVRFAGKPVENDADLVRLTAAALPGSSVEVEPEGFRALLAAAGKGTTVALLIQRESNRQFLPLRVPR
jgi:C-terminal processing protease CtpA/Prc